jgi:ABC-2 type transport system ATP-binding protein
VPATAPFGYGTRHHGSVNAPPAVEAVGLTRRFGRGAGTVVAVDGLDLTVPAGSVYGLIGPNGAGKTTAIRLLTGLLTPSGGRGSVAGVPLDRPQVVKERTGYANQAVSVYGDMSVEENLAFRAALYLDRREARRALERVLVDLALASQRGRVASTLSGGWRQRLAIACAVVHGPAVAFLDEPTANVDPVGRRALWDLMYELARGGMTVVVSTHAMEEAERCSRLALLAQGRLLVEGTPAEVRAATPGVYYRLVPRDLLAALGEARAVPGVRDVWVEGTSLRLAADEPLPQTALAGLGERVERVGASLEDAFVRATHESRPPDERVATHGRVAP